MQIPLPPSPILSTERSWLPWLFLSFQTDALTGTSAATFSQCLALGKTLQPLLFLKEPLPSVLHRRILFPLLSATLCMASQGYLSQNQALSIRHSPYSTYLRLSVLFSVYFIPFSSADEPLTGDLQGEYSRRINDKDRLVYHMENGRIYIAHCRGHYGDK